MKHSDCTDYLVQQGENAIMHTYNRFPIVIAKGEGMYVYDENNKKYVDFVAGIAVNCLGHGHEKLCGAIAAQAKNAIHVSNLYWTKPQIELAKKLTENSCFDKVFLCNSGTEAVEGALKLVRKYAKLKNNDKFEIIAMTNSFHGRTYGAVTATGQAKYQKGLDPLLSGIKHAPFNDFDGLLGMVTGRTCAILIEPIQGEGGIRPVEGAYLQKVRRLCDEREIVLIYDEIQCGAGRTGCLFAYEYFGIEPDVATLAKGLGGGVPIGALLAKQRVAEGFGAGDHASTFGGNPLAATAGNVVLDELLAGGLLDNVARRGAYLRGKLLELKDKFDCVVDVRGVGLIQGIELNVPVADIIARTVENGLLLVNAGTNIIRFVPPFIVTDKHIDEAMEILEKALRS